ncbi:MAG: PfkB family carbohydrate kinase [Candidatus Methanofastidiosia archaeon]
MTVTCCGNINADIILDLKRFPDHHEKVVTDNYFMGQGGSAANTCWWLAKLGIKTCMVGSVGEDIYGRHAIDGLEDAGADTRIYASKKSTGLAVVLSSKQDKRMVKIMGANEDLIFNRDDFSGSSQIHISSVGYDMAAAILAYASSKNIPVSWDPSESLYADLLPYVDLLFINEDDHRRNLSSIEKNPPKNIVVTKNGGGCTINEKHEVPSINDKVVDTTGAGDAFNAGFIYGLKNKYELIECGMWAVACSSLNIRKIGSRAGFTTIEEIKDIVQNAF